MHICLILDARVIMAQWSCMLATLKLYMNALLDLLPGDVCNSDCGQIVTTLHVNTVFVRACLKQPSACVSQVWNSQSKRHRQNWYLIIAEVTVWLADTAHIGLDLTEPDRFKFMQLW